MAIQISGSTVIHDSQDVQVSGVVTATSFHGDASQLTNLPAAGSSLQATASGTLADGDTTIVNTDGTVSAVTQVGSGWIATLGGSGSDHGEGVTVDSSGNVYIIGYTNSAGEGGNELIVAKYNSSGSIQWQKTLGTNTAYRNDDMGKAITSDGSGNIYVAGKTNYTSGYDSMMLAKYDSDGNLQWQKTFGDSNSGESVYGIVLDSSGNIFVCGDTTKNMTSIGALVVKFDNSGNLEWQRTLDAAQSQNLHGIAIDSSDNVYVGGMGAVSGYYHYLLAKYDNSGNFVWQRKFGNSSMTSYGRGITVDSSDNVYIIGHVIIGSDIDSVLVKYDADGNYQWKASLDSSGHNIQTYAVGSDSSDNVYITGLGVGNNMLIAKYDSLGNVDWQRSLGESNVQVAYGITVDNSGHVYVNGFTQSTGSPIILTAKLPSDGTGTGTYGTLTYAQSTLSTGAPASLTDSASSLTPASGNLGSPANGAFLENTVNLTPSVNSMASTNLTSENYIGISDGAYSDGQTATIQLIGSVDDAQSSLTPGQKYYVQGDGTLSTTAGSPSVLAGKAISSTKLAIKG